ncbi:hypothetical protein HWQ46_25435 [Shewanella sp. D64]|uniref:hypothetical protein n=1 Tax=unclassified Shewanella TaxID=196818 RepID=UPI0022BA480D|nr:MULTISPECIES: hypothetical protein [unclassified Shewanella]MEC4728862.1 hypothetical protein [Shewanella sp. D64]MEC4740736.1 hypothetical protein [Shewanella sp. E94]WBJ95305.1 hypothetical protein HWQ47_26550 [Shewanella sp. MTB7]
MTTPFDKCPTCGGDAIDRSNFWESSPPNGRELEEQMHRVRRAIRKYYLALDNGQHGGVAQDKAFEEIQEVLNMYLVRGEVTRLLDTHPQLNPFYE